MKKRKRWLTVLLAAIMLLCVTACSRGSNKENSGNNAGQGNSVGTPTPTGTFSGASEDVTLRIWAPENQIQSGTMRSMCELFQAQHPEWNISFTIEAQGEDTAKESVLKDVAAAADVYFFASDQLQELVNAGAIAKLGGAAKRMVEETTESTVAATVTAEDGNIYAIPFTHNTYFLYYDKTIFDESDIVSIEKIMEKQTRDDVYNFYFESAGGWKLGCWYYGAGLHIYGESQKDYEEGTNWNSETGVAVTNYLIDLISNPKCAFDGDISVSELAADHRIGAWFDGAWNYGIYKDALGDQLGLAILPTFSPDGKEYQLKSFYSSKAIGVNPRAKYPAAAVAFAAYLGNEEMQLKRFEETAQIPTNITAGASKAVQENELARVIVEEVAKASVMQPTNTEFSQRYWTNAGAIATEIRSGILNKNNVQQKLDTFAENMKVK